MSCPTPTCAGPGPDWADRGPNPEDAVPVRCPECGIDPLEDEGGDL